VVGGSSAILDNGTEISSKQLVVLRWDSFKNIFIKHIKFVGKQACFPKHV
jgi:hypothetical protein